MQEYHKIPTVYARDPATKHRTLLEGVFATPELDYLQENHWIFTEKVDGTNIRIGWQDGTLTFGGRTDDAQIPAKLVQQLQAQFLPHVETFASMFPTGTACLYGEGFGKGIQKAGGLYTEVQSFVLFDVVVGEWMLERHNVEDVGDKLATQVVPVIGAGTLDDMVARCKAGFRSLWGDFLAEGIVARPAVEIRTRNGARIITKLKLRDFAPPAPLRASLEAAI